VTEPAPDLSLVFPVFNEEGNLAALLDAAFAVASRLVSRFEIVVVDDGSRDGSAALLGARSRAEPRLRVLTHPANRGYGAALRSGLRAARGSLVCFSDADLQFDLAELERLLAAAAACDIVAGYRAPRRDPWPRRALAFGWGLAVRLLFGLRVRDIDCAFKVFHRRVLEAIPIASLGAFVNTEILVRAQSLGFRIAQAPVSHRPRRHGSQTGARPRVILRAVVELATLYRELRSPEREGAREPSPG
jgi:glycosyltransferase involved in cell wall biosynthesis